MSPPINEYHQRVCLPFGPLIEAKLVARVNRFRVRVRVSAEETSAYLANPGRLEELMIPGTRVWLKRADNLRRKTRYDLSLVEHGDALVSMNSHLPNKLLRAALSQRAIPWFSRYNTVRSEVRFGESRLDFQLSSDQGDVCWLEAKSVTLVTSCVARFPDAPTKRGRRHLEELIRATKQGDQAAVVFVVQRGDATSFAPYDKTDPEFGAALRAADRAGVEIRALRCTISTESICIEQPIAVSLDGQTLPSYNPKRS